MFAPSRRDRRSVDRVIESLPEAYHAVTIDHGLLVVGPTGVFAVTDDEPDVDTAAHRIARTASELRAELASRLSWAPFVDPIVVVDGQATRTEVAGVVPTRLLAGVLTGGRPLLGADEVERITATFVAAPHAAIA